MTTAKLPTNDNVLIIHKDKDGNVLNQQEVSNLVTDAGKALVAARLIDDVTEAALSHIALGTGTTAVAAADTALEAEITTGGGERAAATVGRVTTDVLNDTAQYSYTYTFTAPFAVTETGLLNAASGGTLGARQVFAAINVVATDTLTITWRLDVD